MKTKLPRFFKPLFWWLRVDKLDTQTANQEIITQVINYGNLNHWRWLREHCGTERLRKLVADIPVSAFRPAALRLALLLFKINKLKYASRSDKIRKSRHS